MANLSLKNLCKTYPNGVEAVKNVNLDIGENEFIIFVGPSGCGKTTLLRMIAGLEDITSGELFIDGENMNKVDPKDRDIAMVFQNYALYPHMSVFKNMSLGLKLRKVPKPEINSRVTNTARMLGIDKLLDRKPKQLSGGERQRVAMGRAIVREPKLFLMDEPLSNLDAKLRVQMRSEISKLYRDLKTTFIFVTHDQTEAMTLGTRIVVMRNGEIQQVDKPQNIYHNPANMFVAGFIGSPEMNFIGGNVSRVGDIVNIVIGDHIFPLDSKRSQYLIEKEYENKEIIIGIRPPDIKVDEVFINQNKDFSIHTYVDHVENLGEEINLYFDFVGTTCIVSVSSLVQTKVGSKIEVAFDFSKIHLFDKDTQQLI